MLHHTPLITTIVVGLVLAFVLGALAEIYGLTVPPEKIAMKLADYYAEQFIRPPRVGDTLRLGPVVLVAHTLADGKVVMVGLQNAEPELVVRTPAERVQA